MSKSPPALAVAVVEKTSTAFIKIAGRANFTSSIDFKNLIGELQAKGVQRMVLDLGECVTMDSTFLGVVAGLAIRCVEKRDSDGQPLQLELLNPNQRVADLLENLGVIHLFKVLCQPNPCTAIFEPFSSSRPDPTKDDFSRTCLEAHQALMDINPENIPKFKDVAQFLAEELKKKT